MQISLPSISSQKFRVPPPAVLAATYAILIILGTCLLKIPGVSQPLAWSDALFTATSAVTVTGLSVVDVGSHFSLFGQIVVLVLIQLGGLGLMTFAALVLSVLGLPIDIPHRTYLREDLNQTSVGDLLRLVKVILRVVLLCELIGAILLGFVFIPDAGWAEGIWLSLFHAVSAFNNAGFSLFPDSLTRYATNPLVNFTIPGLLLIGGLGFSVLSDIYYVRRWQKFSLHSKLMLSGSAALILWSVASFAILEWNNPATLGAVPDILDKLQISWFQGTTTRTAGFNTTDIAGMHDSTTLTFILLMLIGGGSTSTAGGIKVTTFIVLLLATVAFFKRRQQLHAFGRSIGLEEVLKVLALTMISMLIVAAALFLMTIAHDGDFLDLLFEVASAFGTVGLSRGITTELDTIGRTVIIFTMFIGRVGPLTLGFFLATRMPPRIRYPSSQIYLG
ncbi:TrkH family potassium uptake protein [Thalassospira marina]|uniref:Ktr system potassium transporter B n=1 Tax=Thalassospira marina TaxID=2048283 RepID=A0A2N3KSZ0_9PROT|nr:TrkH family potassium uptake protein [Thalassospira marina]AUG51350.1 Ktr system potassium transporter B [Thalassospira marina]PKR53593.1 Ktr system potassium transporter B [Thalassospira marina]